MKNCNQEKVVLQQAYENFTSMLNDKQKILLPTPHHMFAEKSSTSPCFAVHLVQEILYSFNISSNTLFCTNPITNDIFIATIEPLWPADDKIIQCFILFLFHVTRNLFHAPEFPCPGLTASSKWSRFLCILLWAPSLDICLSDCIMSLNQPKLWCKSPECKHLVPVWKQTNAPKGILVANCIVCIGVVRLPSLLHLFNSITLSLWYWVYIAKPKLRHSDYFF